MKEQNSINVNDIHIISVSYNSAELIKELLSSIRNFYSNPITIVDGSSAEIYPSIDAICREHENVSFIHFEYNIHHGPGMAWAFQNLDLQGPVLVIDSDVIVLKKGFLESMVEELKPEMYGVGSIDHINEGGFIVDYVEGAIRYLHPACMLCNIDVVRKFPMPIKHGAPMTETMLELNRTNNDCLIGNIPWLKHDFSRPETPIFLQHDWQGTVKRTGSYNLDDWSKKAAERNVQLHLLGSLVLDQAKFITEIGASDGLLARMLKEKNHEIHYAIMKIGDPYYVNEKGMADITTHFNIDGASEELFESYLKTDCWILDQALEHIINPDRLLMEIRKVIAKDASILAIVPNVQHWAMQIRLCLGDFPVNIGNLKSYPVLQWYTRATFFALFQRTGYRIVQAFPIVNDRPNNEEIINAFKLLATTAGGAPSLAIDDLMPTHYVLKAIPI